MHQHEKISVCLLDQKKGHKDPTFTKYGSKYYQLQLVIGNYQPCNLVCVCSVAARADNHEPKQISERWNWLSIYLWSYLGLGLSIRVTLIVFKILI